MRCKRCHAKIDGKKKACPNCGVLVRRKRGLYKLAPTAVGGTSGFLDEVRSELSRLRPGVLIAAGGILLAVIATVCISCAACRGCSCSCGQAQPDAVTYPDTLNSGTAGLEYYRSGTLYYINGSSIFARSDSGEVKTVAEGNGMSALCADDTNIYYLLAGELWAVPFEKPIVVSEEGGSQYAARCIAKADAQGDDPITSISGYAADGSAILYWGACQSGITRVMRLDGTTMSVSMLFEAAAGNIKYYRGYIYFTDTASGELMRCCVQDGSVTALGLYPSQGHYDLGDNAIYLLTAEGDLAYLDKVSTNGKKTLLHIQIGGIEGVCANDSFVYYWKTDLSGSSVMRMSHDGADAKLLLFDTLPVVLKNVSGNYFSVTTTSGLDGSQRYRLFDSSTQQAVY